MGPWDAVGTFFAELIAAKRLEKWYKLAVTMAFSATVTFLSSCGGILLAGKPWPLAVGGGMVASAGALVYLYVRSPLTKGMMIAVPQQAAMSGTSQGLETIEPK